MKPSVYISGRMSGMPGHNYPAFHDAAAAWRAAGWDVLNPAEHFNGETGGHTYLEYIIEDAKDLKTTHAIALLPGWDDPEARGSLWEFVIAQHILGIPCYSATKPIPPAEHQRRMTKPAPVQKPIDNSALVPDSFEGVLRGQG